MTTLPDTSACAACGAGLGADQRYCLNCGAAAPAAAAADVRPLLADPAPSAPAAPALAAGGAPRIALVPGREVSLGLAVGVFAFVLGLAAWAGAKTTSGPGAAPIAIAAAPATAPAAEPGAPLTETDVGAPLPTETEPLDVTDAAPADVPLEDVPVTATDTGTATAPAADDTAPAGDDTAPAGGDDTTAADTPATPPLKHVWLISLTGQGYETLFDPEGRGPYLAKDLTKQGTLLSRYFGVTTGGLANGVALTSGQGPNAATQADCPTVADLAPGSIGKDEQAGGTGCLYSTDVFSVADLLAARTLTWRAYAGALDAAGACPKPIAGSPFPAPRVPFLAFRTITEDATCAERVTGLGRLPSDLGAAKTTPALLVHRPRALRGRQPGAVRARNGRRPARRGRVPAPHRPADPRLPRLQGRRGDRDLRRPGAAGRRGRGHERLLRHASLAGQGHLRRPAVGAPARWCSRRS